MILQGAGYTAGGLSHGAPGILIKSKTPAGKLLGGESLVGRCLGTGESPREAESECWPVFSKQCGHFGSSRLPVNHCPEAGLDA
jgi:hypothetical protein